MAAHDLVLASAGGSGGGGNYIEDVFSTYLYTGNGSTQTITNDIDLSTKGGMVWSKWRTGGSLSFGNNRIFDTARGATKYLDTNLTNEERTETAGITAFNSNGYNLGNNSQTNNSSASFVSWTFRKQPKFFDVVTYTGNGSAPRAISHSLGSTPGCIMIKKTSATGDWLVFHRSAPNQGAAYPNIGGNLYLNYTDAADSGTNPFLSAVDSTTFTLSTNQNATMNASGATYVAYIFAHNAGGFGVTGTDNVISCGSYTGNAAAEQQINLGWEAQWVLVKRTDSATGGNWQIYDTMRGIPVNGSSASLVPNLSDAEGTSASALWPNASGFSVGANNNTNGSARTYIYIAIRRGPMKVPTDGTTVFKAIAATAASPTTLSTTFPADMSWATQRSRATVTGVYDYDRLRGTNASSPNSSELTLNSGGAERSTTYGVDMQSNVAAYDWAMRNQLGVNTSTAYWEFRRAPSFFDEVCYTGSGSNRTLSHNLNAVPELMIVKRRSAGTLSWSVYSATLGNTSGLELNAGGAVITGATTLWNSTTPTSSVFTVGTDASVNTSAATYVAYLFASCPGVAKVFSYTGTGATQTISCGFTGGARWVMIKRTDSTGDWWVWDTARGMIAGTDPRLSINGTTAEANANWVYTTTGGFQIVTTDASVNANGGSYIYLAIA